MMISWLSPNGIIWPELIRRQSFLYQKGVGFHQQLTGDLTESRLTHCLASYGHLVLEKSAIRSLFSCTVGRLADLLTLDCFFNVYMKIGTVLIYFTDFTYKLHLIYKQYKSRKVKSASARALAKACLIPSPPSQLISQFVFE